MIGPAEAASPCCPGTSRPRDVITATGNILYRSGRPEWGTADIHDSAHARLDTVHGLVFVGNSMNSGRDDRGQGQWSPDFSIVVRRLENAIVKDNVMHQGSLRELVVDRGEHGGNVTIKDNLGTLRQI